jgi:thiamine pyrophosphate-dependent acetolactate synthase large subunit-like protein
VFQEVNYRALFGPLVKWVAEVERTDRLAEYIDRAFRLAISGRPGPVVLALPEDVLSAEAIRRARSSPPRPAPGSTRPRSPRPPDPDRAERPMILCRRLALGPRDGARAGSWRNASARRWPSPSGGRTSSTTTTRTTPATWASA